MMYRENLVGGAVKLCLLELVRSKVTARLWGLAPCLVIVLAAQLVLTALAYADPVLSLSVSPSEAVVAVGESFTVEVIIHSDTASRGGQVALAYDPDIIRVNSVEEGAFFKSWAMAHGGTTLVFPQPTIKHADGLVTTMGIAVIGGSGVPNGAMGEGVLCRFNITALAPGAALLILFDGGIANEAGSMLAGVTVSGGTILSGITPTPAPSPTPAPAFTTSPVITPSPTNTRTSGCDHWDVNCDGACNFNDIVAVGLHWGEVGEPCWIPADVNCDGIVNINDIVTIGHHIDMSSIPTATPTRTGSVTPVPTLTLTPSRTQSPTIIPTPSPTPGSTLTPTATPTRTPTSTGTVPATATATKTPTATVVAASTPTPTANGYQAAMRIEPAAQTIGAGQTFDVSVVISSDIQIRGAQVSLGFDPDAVEVIAVDLGDWFAEWAAANGASVIAFPAPIIGNGTVSTLGLSIMGGAPGGPSGEGVLCTYRCRARADAEPLPATSALTLTESQLSNSLGTVLSAVSVTHGQVTVSSGQTAPTATPTPTATASATQTAGPSRTPTPTRTSTPVHNTVVRISPSQHTVAAGETFDVDVILSTQVQVRGAQIAFAFDPSLLEVQSVATGGFLQDWATGHGASVLKFPQPVIDNSTGTVSVMGLSIMGGSGGPSGQGVLCTYRMKAKSNTQGTSALSLSQVEVTDAQATVLNGVGTEGGHVTVQPVQFTATPTSTRTPTSAPTLTRTPTVMPTPSRTPTAAATATRTRTPSGTSTVFATMTPVATFTPAQARDTKVEMLPSQITVAPGQTFELSVQIHTLDMVKGVQVALSYDASLLEVTEVDQGTFLSAWSLQNGQTVLVYPEANIDNATGRVSDYGVSIMGAGTVGPTGQGIFCVYQVRAKAGVTGTSIVRLENVKVSDAAGRDLAGIEVSHGSVQIGGPTSTPMATGTLTLGTSGQRTTPGTGTPPVVGWPTLARTATPTTEVIVSSSSMALEPDKVNVAPGEEFTVDVVLTTDVEVRGAQSALTFDPALVEVIEVTEGAFFKTWADANSASTLVFPEPEIDMTAGRASDIGIAIMGSNPGGPTGKGVFCTYHLVAKTGVSGSSALTLENVAVTDSRARVLPEVDVHHGTVAVGAGDGTSPDASGGANGFASGRAGPFPTPKPTPLIESSELDLSGLIGMGGVLLDDVLFEDESGVLDLALDKGTHALDADGRPLTVISIDAVPEPPTPPRGYTIVGAAIDLGPDGAAFEPAIRAVLRFDPEAIPEEVGLDKIKASVYDEIEGAWTDPEQLLDADDHSISCDLTHFSVIAVLVPDRGTANGTLVAGLLGAALVGGGGGGYLWWRRRRIRPAFLDVPEEEDGWGARPRLALPGLTVFEAMPLALPPGPTVAPAVDDVVDAEIL